MRDLRRSAAYRIAFTYSAAFALAIVLLGALVFVAADAAFRRQQDAALAEEAAELTRTYRSEGLGELVEAIQTRSGGSGIASFGYALFDPDGRRRAGALDAALPPAGLHDVTFRDPLEGPDAARALITPLGQGRSLVVAIDSEALERIDRTILGLFAGAFVLVLLIGAAGALLLGGYLRRRLSQISGTAQAIVAGAFDRRVPVSPRGDEFDQLSGSLNLMLDRIEQLLENLRQVSSDIAHDLRTPLARLRGGLEAALAGPADSHAQRAALKNAVRQSDTLLSLFAGILKIAEVEGGGVAQGFRPVNVSALVADLCDSYAPAVSDGGRTLSCTAEPNMRTLGDRELIAQALINLLDNAQAHTPRGTAITLDGEGSGEWVRVAVADSGPGVPPADRERIVHRFVRLERSRSAAGHGLGLNLVAAIARAHGGELVIADNRPGLRATLVLPRSAA